MSSRNHKGAHPVEPHRTTGKPMTMQEYRRWVKRAIADFRCVRNRPRPKKKQRTGNGGLGYVSEKRRRRRLRQDLESKGLL